MMYIADLLKAMVSFEGVISSAEKSDFVVVLSL